MGSTRVRTHTSHLPANDDHPYRTGVWRPNVAEYDATDLEVIEGEVPDDLGGVYIRNTENPIMGAIERYHPFDGDGMLHAIWFESGRTRYANRLIPTAGLAEELAAGAPLYAGITEAPELSQRPGWGARGGMKDASSTDVIVHRGRAISTFYQCGDAYAFDARTLESLGTESWNGRFPSATGISAHPKVDERTGELFYFRYGKAAPYLHYGVVSPAGDVVHEIPIELSGPRLPHDMALSQRFAILNDFPLYWDPALLQKNVHRPRYNAEMASRFAVVPRRGSATDVRWFEAAPTYALHFSNAWEDGDELVLEGYAQATPAPKPKPEDGKWAWLMSQIDLSSLGARPYEWRFDLRTGKTRERELSKTITEFPSVHGGFAGVRNRYVVSMSAKPGWFLFDGIVVTDKESGVEQTFDYPDGVYASEAPVAPRIGSSAESAAYVVTFVSDTLRDVSECHVFALDRIAEGPIAKIRLPERIASGTHACFASLV
jgi:carotenoid cleavage dioxygenase-like enzyme